MGYDFDFDVIQRSWVYLFRDGMTFTVTLTALAMLGGIALGTILALMRLSSIKILSGFAGGYVNLMRSLPLVLVIFWFFFRPSKTWSFFRKKSKASSVDNSC